MASKYAVQRPALLLDACCVVNLYASDKFQELLESFGVNTIIALTVKHESLHIRVSESEKQPIDLEAFINRGLLLVVDLDLENENESDLYVDLSVSLDDGEAMTGAIAIHRNWAMATDDRKGIRVIKQFSPQTEILTTPELIHLWVDNTSPKRSIITETLNNISFRGRSKIREDHPLFNWWHSF